MMKQIVVITLVLVTAVAVFAGGHIESKCYPTDGTIWTFEVYTDGRDQWDSSASEHPPLSPKKAKDLATAFMKRVPLADKMVEWNVSEITLKRMSREPEHWIYMVHFDAVPDPRLGPWTGPVPCFEVLVRMDGSVPEPKIKKHKQRK